MTATPDPTASPTLALGDSVQLTSGGPSMIVEHTRTDGFTDVVWFVDSEANRDAFPTAALRRTNALRVVGGRK